MTIVGTRPEVIRLSRVIERLDRDFDHVLVHTGQNHDYELNGVFFSELGIRSPDHCLAAARPTAVETIAAVITGADRVIAEANPGAVLVLGDTNSCLALLPSKRRKIPTFHMEAGNRCFDQRVPEEINRRIVDHIADVNLPYSDIAREYLLREGLPPDLVIKTGSPMYEVLHHYRSGIDASDAVSKLDLVADNYFVVSAHREENIESETSFSRLCETLQMLASSYTLPIVVSTHPRTRKRIEASGRQFPALVRLLKPLGFLDYCNLQVHARATLSDSGTISEESAILGFPALNLREAHERPEGMESAAVMMVGLEPTRVLQGLDLLASQRRDAAPKPQLPPDYSAPDVSAKVSRILLSYVDYVNRVVWRRTSANL